MIFAWIDAAIRSFLSFCLFESCLRGIAQSLWTNAVSLFTPALSLHLSAILKAFCLREKGLGASQFCEGARAPYAPFVSLRAKRSNPHCHAIGDCFASLAMTHRNPPFPASPPPTRPVAHPNVRTPENASQIWDAPEGIAPATAKTTRRFRAGGRGFCCAGGRRGIGPSYWSRSSARPRSAWGSEERIGSSMLSRRRVKARLVGDPRGRLWRGREARAWKLEIGAWRVKGKC